ncbi:hypothetical protein D3C71_1816210 [compost metagenome]
MPAGRICVWIVSTTLRTPSEISTVLDCAWRMMPRPMPWRPLERSAVVPESGPSVTVPMSRSRTLLTRMRFSNCSGVCRSAVARTEMSWLALVSLPAGTS